MLEYLESLSLSRLLMMQSHVPCLEALQSEWLSVVKRTFIHLPIPSSMWSGPSSGQKTASTSQAAEINKITMIMCEEQGKGLLADFLGF